MGQLFAGKRKPSSRGWCVRSVSEGSAEEVRGVLERRRLMVGSHVDVVRGTESDAVGARNAASRPDSAAVVLCRVLLEATAACTLAVASAVTSSCPPGASTACTR